MSAFRGVRDWVSYGLVGAGSYTWAAGIVRDLGRAAPFSTLLGVLLLVLACPFALAQGSLVLVDLRRAYVSAPPEGPGGSLRRQRRLLVDGGAVMLWLLSGLAICSPEWIPNLNSADSASLVEHFQENRAKFDVLAGKIAAGQDAGVEAGLKDLGLCGTYRRHGKGPEAGTLLNIFENPIWANAGYFEGYYHCAKEPEGLVKDIDKDAVYSMPNFQKIGDGWYLYYYYY